MSGHDAGQSHFKIVCVHAYVRVRGYVYGRFEAIYPFVLQVYHAAISAWYTVHAWFLVIIIYIKFCFRINYLDVSSFNVCLRAKRAS